MPVTIKGSGGGSVTLDAGAAAADTTLTLPNSTGTVINTAPGTAGNVLTSNGSAWTSAAPAGGGLPTATAIGQIPFSTDGSTYTATQKIVQSTAVASTSGTSIDFTGIPSWVKRVTVMLSNVSTSGTANLVVQVGSGSVSSSGYTGTCSLVVNAGGTTCTASTTYFQITQGQAAAANNGGIITLVLLNATGNVWAQSGLIYRSDSAQTAQSVGNISLSGALDRVRITTTNGTDTFDAGSINILYE